MARWAARKQRRAKGWRGGPRGSSAERSRWRVGREEAAPSQAMARWAAREQRRAKRWRGANAREERQAKRRRGGNAREERRAKRRRGGNARNQRRAKRRRVGPRGSSAERSDGAVGPQRREARADSLERRAAPAPTTGPQSTRTPRCRSPGRVRRVRRRPPPPPRARIGDAESQGFPRAWCRGAGAVSEPRGGGGGLRPTPLPYSSRTEEYRGFTTSSPSSKIFRSHGKITVASVSSAK